MAHGLGLAAAVLAGRLQLATGLADAPTARDGYPTRDEVIDYLTRYEARYGFPVERPKAVDAVEPAGAHLLLRFADGETRTAQAVVSARGTWGAPVVPGYPGSEGFGGTRLHSAH